MQAAHETRDFAQHLRRRPSLPEGLLWRALKARKLAGLQFRKQHPLGPYVLDFYCHEVRLCVEIDGSAHIARWQTDERRDAWLAEKGIRTLRLSAQLVLKEMDDALRTIAAAAGRDCGF